MSDQPKLLYSGELTAAGVDLFTADANTTVQFAACSVANKTATPRWVTITIDTVAGAARNVVYRVTVPINRPYTVPPVIALGLNAGDKISAAAEIDAALDMHLFGFVSTAE
jgi:hypothetical protein